MAAKDGTLWGLLGGELAHIDPAARQVRFFSETLPDAGNMENVAGVTIGADGTIYFGGKGAIWIHHPDKPSPPADYGQ